MAKRNGPPRLETVVHAILQVSRALNTDPATLGVTRSQWWVLRQLQLDGSDGGEGTNQAMLAKKLNISRATMGETITRLEAAGLIQRMDSKADRRSNLLVITAAGHDVLAKVNALDASLLQRGVAGLSVREQRGLERALEVLGTNLHRLDQ